MLEILQKLDYEKLNFNEDSSIYLNITIAFIMLGVALELDVREFRTLVKSPKSPLLGILAQFILLPFLTFLAAIALQSWITPAIGLGMILVAACPGGNVSNFITNLAKGNLALSVSLTTFSSVSSLLLTPFNFLFWGNMFLSYYSGMDGHELVRNLDIDAWSVVKTLLFIMALPLVSGVMLRNRFPVLIEKIVPYVKKASIVIFAALIIVIFCINYDLFLKYIKYVFLIVFLHNALAMATGYFLGRGFKLNYKDSKTLAIETGIQNTSLALALLFNPEVFPPELPLGGMAFICAWYGVWHIIAGMSFAFLSKK